MFDEICQYLRNWFERDKYIGDFAIVGGTLTFMDGDMPLLSGQYYRIIGSILNDGVHKHGSTFAEDDLEDEEFSGAVWSMAIPPALITLEGEITAWIADNSAVINSPFQSESFGGYSYNKGSSGSASGDGSSAITWQSQFAARLAPWRKI